MKVAIHQPHYFPWLGYLHKMACVDKFVLLDEVQLEKGSQMIRNRVIDQKGEIKFLTISGNTKNYLSVPYRELQTKNNPEWTDRQFNAIKNYYHRAEYKDVVLNMMRQYYECDFSTINEWTCESINLLRRLFGISTEIVFQSQIEYNRNSKKSDLVLEICKSIGADTYYSGRGGSSEYLDCSEFKKNGIEIEFQNFVHPVYQQINVSNGEFIKGVSSLDILFNCGIEKSKQLFWDTVKGEQQ